MAASTSTAKEVKAIPPRHSRLTDNASYLRLQQIVTGLSEGIILIDTDQAIVWANEAAMAMHGVETLGDLGGNVAGYRDRFQLRYRNNHLLDRGRYPIDRVIAGETFKDVVVQVTSTAMPESGWVHRIRSLVLTDEDGRPDCLVLIINDVTSQFEAEDRFERAFDANPAPAIVCRIDDLKFIKVNRGFLGMTGLKADDVLGHSIYEFDLLASLENKEEAIRRLRAHETISQGEATLSLPDGTSKLVIVAGQPIQIGEEASMLFTFADLEPRRQTQLALAQSEALFATAFNLSPVPFAICTLEGFRFVQVNEAFMTLTGRDRQVLVDAPAADLGLWDDAKAFRGLERRLAEGERLRNVELRLRTPQDHVYDCLFSADLVTIAGERQVLVILQDITERKRTETELIESIETVMQDTSWFSRTLIEKMAALRPTGHKGHVKLTVDLTPREREILTLICQGNSNDEIAAALGVSRNTVRNHAATIYGKIGVKGRAAAIIWGRDRGLSRSR